MPKYKSYDSGDEQKSLKNADREKVSDGGIFHSHFDGLGKNDRESGGERAYRKTRARRHLPIAVDIIIAILLLAVVSAVVAGGYFALRYFTIDYDSVNIEYSILVEQDNVKKYADLAGKHLYMDGDANTLYMGKVKSVDIYEADGAAVITVEFEAKYKSEQGYFADDYKIAVGKKLDIRTDSIKISGNIVELNRVGKAKRSASSTITVSGMNILYKEGIN